MRQLRMAGWSYVEINQTKMTRSERVERLWLVMSVATLWVLRVGGGADFDLVHASHCTVCWG